MSNKDRTSEFLTCYLDGCRSIFGGRIVYFNRVNSTMEEALRLARKGAPEGTVVLTDDQMTGRGRRGRQWISMPGGSLIFSIILREENISQHVMVAASVAVLRTLRDLTGLKITIKWPNDVLIRRKKAVGLLFERHNLTDKSPVLILGMGVNVNLTPRDFQGPLASTATSLFIETGLPHKPADILGNILRDFKETYTTIMTEKGITKILAEYNRHSELIDRRVIIRDEERMVEGIAGKLDLNGGLQIRTDSISREILYTGEVVKWE